MNSVETKPTSCSMKLKFYTKPKMFLQITLNRVVLYFPVIIQSEFVCVTAVERKHCYCFLLMLLIISGLNYVTSLCYAIKHYHTQTASEKHIHFL